MAVPAGQREVAALLERLAGRAPVETHISAVFVGPDTVWKLRKAVRLPFVDFQTVAEREAMARRELALNAAAAPGLYRDVAAIRRAPDGTLALDGPGETVDWVTRMAPIQASDFMDRIAAEGRLDAALLDALGDAVAALQAGYPVVRRGQAEALRTIALGNSRSAREAGLDPPVVRRWLEAVLGEVARLAHWLDARGEQGFVRRTHGDLHLGNLCLWQGRPTAFDALEFDEDLATLDVGYDLAFLLMDLDVRVARAAANRVMNRVLALNGDHAVAAGLAMFLSQRAMVRAHVEASRLRPADSARYLAAAQAYLARPDPVLLAVGGLPGTGKSTLARALAPELGAAPGAMVLRSDEIRKRRHGVAPEQRLPPSAYAEVESRAVFATLTQAARTVLAAGHSVVADATFLDPADRAAVAAAAGRRFLGLWLTAPLAVLEQRVAARRGDASDADAAVLRRAAAAWPGSEAAAPEGWLAVPALDAAAALNAARTGLRGVLK